MRAVRRPSSEEGAIIIILLGAVCLVLTLGVLLLDTQQAERAARSVQSVVDAAALAGAVELRSTSRLEEERQQGWIRAKRAVVAFLKNNAIYGLDSGVFSGPFPVSGSGRSCPDPRPTGAAAQPWQSPDPFENGLSNYRFQDYDCGAFTLLIDRGVWNGSFHSLEIGRGNTDPSGRLCTNAALCAPNTDVRRVANAVRVQLTIKQIPSFLRWTFGGVQGITRDSVSSPDR